jgi:hypothetical protein
MKPLLGIVLVITLALPAACPVIAADTAASAITERKREKALRENDRAAEEAMARDSKTFSGKQFRELEADYQAASARFREADAKSALEAFLKKWTKGNRVGCATLYLAQKSSGEEKEKLLRECIERHSDCYYLNGAQVGGLARLFLWDHLTGAGRADEAAKVLTEIHAKFALCNDHSGRLLADIVAGDK